jgi:hypothetical protein
VTVTAAPTCKAALAEATKLWPNRSRASDGILPSAAHTTLNPTSDHEKGNAFDLTHDPANGVDCNVLSKHVMADSRVRYIIWNAKIWNPSVSPRWRDYTGTNPHTKHMHVSILAERRDDLSPWWTFSMVKAQEKPVANAPFVAALVHPDGSYIRIGADGGVFAHGPASHFYGSAGGMKLNSPVVDADWTPSYKGYWMVAADGGVFAFGDAVFHGSTGGVKLNRPIVGITANDDGGYLLIAEDGGIFAFGPGAEFHGAEPQWAG